MRSLRDAAAQARKSAEEANDKHANIDIHFHAGAQGARLRSLTAIIDATLLAPARQSWRASFVEGERRAAVWLASSRAVKGKDFSAALKRLGAWRRAGAETNVARVTKGELLAGIQSCFLSEPRTAAGHSVLRRLLAALDEDRWPSDARDGAGAVMEAFDIVGLWPGDAYLRTNWKRLSDGVAAGKIPPGALAAMRVYMEPDPGTAETLKAFMARFETEWTQIGTFLSSLPAPRNVGEELQRRTRLEQYGRLSMSAVSREFPTEYIETGAIGDIWKKVEVEDKANTTQLKELLGTRDWFDDTIDGWGAENYGWLIVQHSDDDPEFQREVLKKLEPLLLQGRVDPRNYAYLWDRVAVKDERPQRYGTQFSCKDGQWVVAGGVEDPDNLDARRKAVGMGSWKEYSERLLERQGGCSG